LRIVVDRELCEANAVCCGLAPSVFRIDDDERLEVLTEQIAEADLPSVREAIRRCPRLALRLLPE
jgi:ferredoxin